LVADPQDVTQVFTVIRCLAGRSVEHGYHRLLNTSAGGRIAYEHLELVDYLSDDQWLADFAGKTVGAAYRSIFSREKLSTARLASKSRRGLDSLRNDTPHPYAWFGRRIRDTHDIWHVLTGYGTDILGEACLAAFSYAQTEGLGWVLLAGGGAFYLHPVEGHSLRRAVWEGYLRGRRAAWLSGEDYLSLLAEPLEAARLRLNLPPAVSYDSVPAELRNPVRHQ
jgi:ubiquinone biosynthesis protein COQ4